MSVLARLRPSRPMSLSEAESAADFAYSALRSATANVTAVAERFPIADRRFIASMPRGSGVNDGLDYMLSDEQRETRQRRPDFDTAVAAENQARIDHENASAILNEVRRAAELKAMGDGRAALVSALRRVRAAEQGLVDHDKAITAARETGWDLNRAITKAEEAVERAVTDAGAHAIALVKGTAGDAPRTPREARADLQDLKDAAEATASVVATLTAQQSELSDEARRARDSVGPALAYVVSFAPETVALAERYQEVNAEWVRLRGVMDAIKRAGGALPEGIDSGRVDSFLVGEATALAWTSAITALKTDPAAKLPRTVAA